MKGKFTILPRRLDQMVKQNIESKKMQVLMTGFLFAMFLCLLVMFTPVFASLGSFFGYPAQPSSMASQACDGHPIPASTITGISTTFSISSMKSRV